MTRSPPRFRPSFTLVELLVAIAIIGTMAGMVMFSLAGAQTDANITRTRGTIAKLNAVILQEWEKFRYRSARIEVPNEWFRPVAIGTNFQPLLLPRNAANLRYRVLRDLMRMELPDRFNDLLYPPAPYPTTLNLPSGPAVSYTGTSAIPLPPAAPIVDFPGERVATGKYNNYRRALGLDALPAEYDGDSRAVGVIDPSIYEHQGAECLYLIVSSANYQGGSALESFRSTEIGDIDNDGLFEFWDAWGNPIEFLRWPSGSESVLNAPGVPDPMDPLRVHPKWSEVETPWLLIPLIFSAGPDGEKGIYTDYEPPLFDHAERVKYALTLSSDYAPYDAAPPSEGKPRLGSIIDRADFGFEREDALDNISNYDLILE